MKVTELKEELQRRDLSIAGLKKDLVARLEEADKEGSATKREADEPAEGESEAKKAKVDDQTEPSTEQKDEKPSTSNGQEQAPAATRETAKTEVKDEKPLEQAEQKTIIEPENNLEDAAGDNQGTILERGAAYFFFRVKVDVGDEPEGIDDIAKFELILVPRDQQTTRFRHIDIGRKQLPDTESGNHRPYWAAVTSTGEDLTKIGEGLASKSYETKTRGPRTMPAARPAGRGTYLIHVEGERSKRSTHLCYVLTDPEEPGPVQQELSIYKEGAFGISVKDPHADGPAGATLKPSRRADYPKELQDLFRTKFRLIEPPTFLDYDGAELLLIPSKRHIADEVGPAEAEKLEDEADNDHAKHKDMFKELHLDHKEFPTAALQGEWA